MRIEIEIAAWKASHKSSIYDENPFGHSYSDSISGCRKLTCLEFHLSSSSAPSALNNSLVGGFLDVIQVALLFPRLWRYIRFRRNMLFSSIPSSRYHKLIQPFSVISSIYMQTHNSFHSDISKCMFIHNFRDTIGPHAVTLYGKIGRPIL